MAFRFEKLEIWQSAIVFTTTIYTHTKQFPREELFSLGDQLRRSSSSIAANIAEGSGSSSKKDFIHYLDISIKSTYETISHLYIAKQQNYITPEIFIKLYNDGELLSKKIRAFKAALIKNS